MIWKIRSPDAVARCPSPIHIPSIRSGKITIESQRLNATKSATDIDPSCTIFPPTSSTAACASSGTNASTGT